ncbi:regulator of volume decrease after cellular swelling domain-containing protein [Phthorimaea operculella]|nr:regulator of volume decrease after cellular swelling domain-containing protein [Phthorimaea operculella]
MVVVSPNFSAPEEGVLCHAPCTKMLVNGHELGTGSLFITENNVVWGGGVSPSGAALSTISMLYPTISMHAVQREPSSSLVVFVNFDLRLPELPQGGAGDADEDEDDEFDPDDQPVTELRFIPQNESDISAMYAAMCQGQALHPDPADTDDDADHYMDGEDQFHEAPRRPTTPPPACDTCASTTETRNTTRKKTNKRLELITIV